MREIKKEERNNVQTFGLRCEVLHRGFDFFFFFEKLREDLSQSL